MRAYSNICIIVIFIGFLGCQVAQKEKIVEEVESNTEIIKNSEGQKIDSLLTPYIEKLRVLTDNDAGMAVGVTKGNDVIYARTFGFANIETKEKADFNTLFHIASISKPFCAFACAKLIQQGKLSLDDKLIDYIPEFSMKGEGYEDITIQHILTHTSGIPRHISSGDWENPSYGPNALEENLDFVKDFELDFPPGSEYDYSNSAFDILGIVVNRASGMPYGDFVKKEILKPSQMSNSEYYKPKGELPQGWAVPYSYGVSTQEWSPYPYTEKYFPSSGLQTTLLDMCNWGIMHVNEGSINGSEVLDKEHFDMVVTPYQDTPWGDKIGLSWFLQSYLDRPNIMHIGNDTGFEAIMFIFPKEEISIIVMANRDFSRTGRILNAAAEVIFDEEVKDYSLSARYPFSKVYNEKGIDAAIDHWETMKSDTTDIYYTDEDDILTIGAVLENEGNWKASKETLEFYLSMYDQSTYAWRLLGNDYLNLGDTTKAKECYEQTLKINPNYEKGKLALESLVD